MLPDIRTSKRLAAIIGLAALSLQLHAEEADTSGIPEELLNDPAIKEALEAPVPESLQSLFVVDEEAQKNFDAAIAQLEKEGKIDKPAPSSPFRADYTRYRALQGAMLQVTPERRLQRMNAVRGAHVSALAIAEFLEDNKLLPDNPGVVARFLQAFEKDSHGMPELPAPYGYSKPEGDPNAGDYVGSGMHVQVVPLAADTFALFEITEFPVKGGYKHLANGVFNEGRAVSRKRARTPFYGVLALDGKMTLETPEGTKLELIRQVPGNPSAYGFRPDEEKINNLVDVFGEAQGLITDWARDGESLVAGPVGQAKAGVTVRAQNQDIRMHLDFLVPSLPDACRALRPKALVHVGSYVIQLADSYGMPVSDRSNGAITDIGAPLANASYVAGEWQALDVTISQEDGISVWINGQQVQAKATLPKEKLSDAENKEGKYTLMLESQGHPFQFQNFWYAPLKNAPIGY